MRIDLYLVEEGLCKSRSQAQDLIKRGLVSVDDEIVTKTGFDIKNHSVKIMEEVRFVSRSGEKLLQAIVDFHIDLNGKIIVDIGSSTGGFTDCSLQHGAKHVYAYDVGTNQMDETLKKDPRISLFEQTNILDVNIPTNDLVLIDVSFTSIMPIISHIESSNNEAICLIKPQFEAGNINFTQGVLKDMKKHKTILHDVINHMMSYGYYVYGLEKADLKGKQGNQEYIIHIKKKANHVNIDHLIGSVV
ncbi:MAG: TlyA family RNA methyltransferase [Acholeplasmataceae bacterium]|jgi:23S rRNA (cytidine1920-2'-O)/16S rRNA (cytidine1409-2'-O)-methyltransferase|nr:TlyA family RNA methyltransferase [Acholeplasmataceae bacterium]